MYSWKSTLPDWRVLFLSEWVYFLWSSMCVCYFVLDVLLLCIPFPKVTRLHHIFYTCTCICHPWAISIRNKDDKCMYVYKMLEWTHLRMSLCCSWRGSFQHFLFLIGSCNLCMYTSWQGEFSFTFYSWHLVIKRFFIQITLPHIAEHVYREHIEFYSALVICIHSLRSAYVYF